MADKLIGKLTLDISDVEKKVNAINTALATIGKGAIVKMRIADEVKSQINQVYQSLQDGVKKINDAANKAIQAVNNISNARVNKAQENKDLKDTINALREYYTMLKLAAQAKGEQNFPNEKLYSDAAAAAMARVNQELRKEAEGYQVVIKARMQYEATMNKVADKQATASENMMSAAAKAEAAEIEKATQAYIKMLEAKNKLKELEARGMQDTPEYAKAAEAAGKATDAFMKYSKAARDAAKSSNEARAVIRDLSRIIDATSNAAEQNRILDSVKQKYFELTEAIKRYNAERQSKNELGMAAEQARIDSIMEEIHIIDEAVRASDMEAGAKQKILNITQQCITAEMQHNGAIQQAGKSYNEVESQLNGLLTRYLSLMAIIRMTSSLIQNTVEYVSEYSDKMNEIQIITQKSNAEVERLSETYKSIADMMNVSTLDIAEAAVYFTRQGLAANEIEQRLINVTQYAKTANVEFKEASEIITAVVNSMGLVEQEADDGRNATQRVADTFLKVGDSAATSGEEIGRAMQKAAASAGAFGVSFEWLTSAIATVSETTRQEARTIGTAFNTIIARLHQIKSTGYNQEDETKINDVAKALAKIDVALMDQYGNWRDMEDVWNDVAAKWGDLDGKTKSYIATTMAGVKQQNVFLAAMNDMSKTVEEGGRFWQLYALAMDSAGTAEEKYATWTDSVAASQERLTLAQEKFYSLLGSNVIKNWNDMLASYVGMIADGAEAWGTWTVVLPAVTASIVALGVAIKGTQVALSGATTLLAKHPMMLAAGAFVAVLGTMITMINAAASETETMKEKFEEAQQSLTEVSKEINHRISLQGQLANMIADVGTETSMTSDDINRYNGLLNELSSISPAAKATVDELRNGMIDQTEAAKKLNEEIDKTIEKEQKLATMDLIKKYSNWSATQTQTSGFLNAMGNWSELDLDPTDSTSFALALKDIYNRIERAHDNANTFNGLINKFMTRDVYDEIKKLYKQQSDLTGRVDWGLIGDYIYNKFVGTDDMAGLTDALMQYAEEAIDDVVNTLGVRLDSVERDVLREALTQAIMGDDFEIDIDEYREMGARISNFLLEVLNGGWDYADVGAPAKLNAIGKNLFGNYFKLIFEDQIADAAKDEELVQSISEAYQELLAAGFEDDDIAEVLEHVPLKEWDQMIDLLKNHMVEKIRSEFGDDFMMLQGNFGEEDIDMMEDLDVAAVKLILDMKRAGMTADEFLDLFIESGLDMDAFISRLSEMAGGIDTSAEDAEEETESLLETIKKLTAEIDKYDKIIDTLKKGEPVDMNDLLNLADAHPEIMAVANDVDSLLAAVQKLKTESMSQVVENLRKNLLESTDFASQQKMFNIEPGKTLGSYAETGEAARMAVDAYVNQIVASFLAHSGQLQNVGKEILGNWMTSIFDDSNVDLLNRKAIQMGDKFATVLTETLTASADGKEGLKWNEDVVINLTPITPDGELLTKDTVNKYIEDLLAKSDSQEGLLVNDKIENGGKGLIISVEGVGEEGFEVAINNASTLAILLHLLQEAYYGVAEAAKTWLQLQIEQQELEAANEWAKSNGYIEQISELNNALAEGGSEGVQKAVEIWDQYDQTLQKAILDTYPELGRAILEAKEAIDEEKGSTEKATTASDNLSRSLEKAAKYATVKNFKETYSAIQKLQKGTISATDAFDVFNKELKDVESAQKDVNEIQQKIDEEMELSTDDATNLAKALGITAQQVIDDFPSALAMFEDLKKAGQEAFDELNKEATMKILGIGEADFSQLQSGMVAVQDTASATVRMLLALGQFRLEERDVQEGLTIPIVDANGNLSSITATTSGRYQFLVPTGNNPMGNLGGGSSTSSGKGGGGGGGGGKKNDKNKMTEVERMLDNMSQLNAIQEYQQSYYQAQSKYYSQTGQLQGIIAYSEKEIEILNEQTAALEDNVAKIEEFMDAKKAELDSMTTSDEEYEEVADDLDKLQKAHQEYTKRLIENKTAVDELTKAIEEQKKRIREMEINLRNTILGAIEDREKRTEDMLNAEIEMENTILDIIKKRYEKERDQIIETTNMKIDALREERDLLDEQLQKRKEIEEAEDKQKQLNELELKYQRILADPTRLKESKDIKKQIDELRKEMAWDLAEEEVNAQQESIDQQTESLEDYIEYVENYYEDLFEHPQKLIEEMREIIQMADADIIEWLKTQDETFAQSTENTQKKMVQDWQDTLDQMRDVIKTYWDEVEFIISQGEDYIINFLQENVEEYRKAGKLQAEAYVDEWREQLEDLRKAYEAVSAQAAAAYRVIEKSESDSSKSGGGGGGGSGDPNKKHKSEAVAAFYNEKGLQSYLGEGYGKTVEAANEAAMKDAKSKGHGSFYDRGSSVKNVYKEGGIADFTGYAWLDGTKTNPERILNPYQNKLFETMVGALERMDRVFVPTMPNFGDIKTTGGNPVDIGDIIINVANLDTDDDYNTIANKVCAVIMDRIGKTSAIGGLRIQSI